MVSLNRVLLAGNLVRRPTVRYTLEGVAVGELRLAVGGDRRGEDGGERPTLFLNVRALGAVAERCERFLVKGVPVLVRGRLSTRTWTDRRTGQSRSRLEVMAEEVEALRRDAPERDGPRW